MAGTNTHTPHARTHTTHTHTHECRSLTLTLVVGRHFGDVGKRHRGCGRQRGWRRCSNLIWLRAPKPRPAWGCWAGKQANRQSSVCPDLLCTRRCECSNVPNYVSGQVDVTEGPVSVCGEGFGSVGRGEGRMSSVHNVHSHVWQRLGRNVNLLMVKSVSLKCHVLMMMPI